MIFTVLSGGIFTIFWGQWASAQERSIRETLWGETNLIVEAISQDGRRAHKMAVAETDDGWAITFADDKDVVLAQYVAAGQKVNVSRDGVERILSQRLVKDESSFVSHGKGLKMVIVLRDDIFGRPVKVITSSEVFLRN